ncbi:uncharacterized protein LOC134280909 [Saccostrea cucullata]|uniref:uncharacterized protein LOC134280909 n=1 Tax=Saccostrea cuccullata TaxID=36930 RepID=UPI002ED0A653
MSPGIGCPDSFSEQRVKALQCSSQNLYHCLYNELDEIVEICTESIWIPAGNCPVYNNGASKLNYVPCQTSRGECPSDVFFSNEILKYSGCIPLSRSPEATLLWEINTPYLNSTTDNTFENTGSTSPLLFLLIPLVFLALILIILLAIIRRRKGICTREGIHFNASGICSCIFKTY